MQHATYICDLFNSSATLCLYILNGAGPNGTGEDGVKERFGIKECIVICVMFTSWVTFWHGKAMLGVILNVLMQSHLDT